MSLAEYTSWIVNPTTATTACLLLELLWFRLAWKYGWLFAYFLADFLQTVLVIGEQRYTLKYGYVYFGGQGVKTLLAIAVSLQLSSRALAQYPALVRFGRRIGVYILIGAGLVAAGGLLLEPARRGIQSPFTHDFNAIEGAFDSAVALFLLIVTLFLLWFPVKIPRNVAIFIGGFAFYSLGHRAGLLVLNFFPASNLGVGTAVVSVSFSCLAFWILAVRPEGKTRTTITGHRWNPEDMDRLLRQLDGINTRLENLKAESRA